MTHDQRTGWCDHMCYYEEGKKVDSKYKLLE